MACLKLTRKAGATLIINDRVDVALTAGADGVHLGQDDLSVDEAREILGEDKIIGVSTHSIAHSAPRSKRRPITCGRAGLSDNNQGESGPVVGLELVREARKLTDRPLVAIGGINLGRAPEVIASARIAWP